MQVLASHRTNQNKQNHTNEPNKEIQRLKVELNDRIFELHKLEEDHAQEKAKIYIQLQKEKQGFTKTIKELKDKIRDDNEGWVRKIDEMRRDKEDSISRFRDELEQQIRIQTSQTVQNTEEKCNRQVKQLSHRMAQMEEGHRKREEELIREGKVSAENMLQSFRKQEQERERKHKNQLSQRKKQYEDNISKMQTLYQQEVYLRQQVETDLQSAIKSHVMEKITWEGTHCNINGRINNLQEEIVKLEATIHCLGQEKKEAQRKHANQLENLTLSHLAQIKRRQQEHQDREQENCYKYSNQIKNLKSQIDSLIQIHKKKQQSWLESGKMVLQLYQKRQSKKQDVKAIQKLEVELIKKDFLIQRQRKQLKNCKLQLQNMQQIYDRIFIYNSNLNRSKAKSYQIKKMKASTQINQSNRSTIISDKNSDKRYPSQKNE